MSNETQLKINDLTGEQITTVITSLGNKLENEVDNSTDYLYSLIGLPSFILNVAPLEQVGLTSVVSIPYVILISSVRDVLTSAMKAADNYTSAADMEKSILNEGNAASSATDMEKSIFNIQFEGYEGLLTGNGVKALLNTIEAENDANLDHQVECNKTITDIDSSENYIVSFEKDSEGYINKVIIEEQ